MLIKHPFFYKNGKNAAPRFLRNETLRCDMYGAGEGNRTLDNSLEGCGFTTKLHPQNIGYYVKKYVNQSTSI